MSSRESLEVQQTHRDVGNTDEARERVITSVSVQERIADCADVYLLRIIHPPWQAQAYNVVGTPSPTDYASRQDF